MDGAEQHDRGSPLRSWVLGIAGVVVGYCIHRLAWDPLGGPTGHPMPIRLALATFLAVAGVAFAVTWSRLRPSWAIGFAILTGLVVAAVIDRNGGPEHWDAADGWRLACAVLAIGIAAPLFQVWRDTWTSGARPSFPYPRVHREAWTNVVLLFAGLLFVLVVWLLAWLLAGLFELIKLSALRDLLAQAGSFWVLSGGALGAGLGLLRDRDGVLATLQRVVIVVLAALAPVLASGFCLFLLSLPFTGLAPLWQATKATTPLLLTCCIVALILANAVIADRAEDEARHPVLRWAGLALALVVLPFVGIAAVSIGLRIDQHGLTPSRLWAITFTAVVAAYGIAYWVSAIRDRAGWMAAVRRANLQLAFGICALLLVLSLPLVSFGAIATRDQIARLESGRVSAGRFDWRALRFDFGPSGVAALEWVAQRGRPAERAAAVRALAASDRWKYGVPPQPVLTPLATRLRGPKGAAPPDPLLIGAIDADYVCRGEGTCFVRVEPDRMTAFAVYQDCARGQPTDGTAATDYCRPRAAIFRREAAGWQRGQLIEDWHAGANRASARALADAIDAGRIDVRPVTRRQLFIGGRPFGDAVP